MTSRIILFLLFGIASVAVVLGQPGLPGDPAQSPIDGGLLILAGAGGAYAIKKLRDRTKQ